MQKKLSMTVAIGGALLLAGASAGAASILSNSSVGLYNAGLGTSLDTNNPLSPFPCDQCNDSTLSFPTAPDLSTAAFALGHWLTTPTAPGGTWSTSAQSIPSQWTLDTETAIIYTIQAGPGLTNLNLRLGVDNGVFVWLDGAYKFGARGSGYSFPGDFEYSLTLPNLKGTHYLQILREDHGIADGFNVDLSLNQVSPVPEPSTLMLGLFGLAVVGAGVRIRERNELHRNRARA